MYQPRTIDRFLTQTAMQFPVLLLTGARQVGKTTLLRHLAEPRRSYATLDDPLLLELARGDPALFLQRFPPPVLIDEIQYAPQLLPHIKMAVDNERIPGHFWLTGSQQFQMMRGVSESLAGRVAVVQLLGLSRRELAGVGADAPPFLPERKAIETRGSVGPIDLQALYRLIWRGSLPEIAVNEALDRDLFYSSYIQTYLQRDVRDLAKVGDESAFLRFLRASAARSAQMLKLSELARDADIAPNTAKQWLSILQTSGIVHLLEPYHSNVTKRLIKTPKLYMLDTGLCSYLTEWTTPETLAAGAMAGPILETWIFAEILKSYWHNGRQAPLHYYRDKDQKEIDLLITRDGQLYPIEIKRSASPSRKDIRHFSALDKLDLPTGPGGLICLATQSLPLTESIMTIPVALL